jgi:uncharacterized protein (DUF58 family)
MTPNGLVVALGAGCATAFWLLTHEPAALAVAVVAAALLVIGLPQRLRPRGALRIELGGRDHTVERGTTTRLALTGSGRGIARLLVDGHPAAELPVGPGRDTGWTTPALRRGRLGVAVEQVSDVDVLGLWRRRLSFTAERLELTVLPRRVDLAPPPETADPEDDGRPATAVGGYGMTFAGLREYQPGDDIRHIDWAASARSADDGVYVRQFAPALTDDLLVILDVYRPANDLAFETAVDLAYSFTRSGADLYLAGRGRFRAGDEAEEVLLSLGPGDAPGTPPLGARAAAAVVVTAAPERAGQLTQAYAPSVPVFTIGARAEVDLTAAREVWRRWAAG